MGAVQIFGFFTMLPIWSMEVPSPWASKPPQDVYTRQLKTHTGGRRRHSTGGLGMASGLLGQEGRGRAFAHADDTGPHAAFKRLLQMETADTVEEKVL